MSPTLDFLQNYSSLLIYPMVALLLSGVLTWTAIRLLPRFGYIDKPGGRHIHQRTVPRGGGIAVIVAFFFAFALYAIESDAPGAGKLFWRLLCPAVVLAALGILDDDISLHGLRLHGFKVLGGAADVETIYMNHPFDKVVITTALHRPENEEMLRNFCRAKNIPLTRLDIHEEACIGDNVSCG